MKRILLTVIVAAAALGVNADDSHFLQLSLTPEIALHPKDHMISGISLNIWGENQQSGFTLGFVNGSVGESRGFTMGLVNYTETYRGVQWGMLNTSSELFVGWQDGLVNVAKEMHGVQTGVVNYADSLHGLQLGLVCLVKDSTWFSDFPNKLAPAFVFVNWSF